MKNFILFISKKLFLLSILITSCSEDSICKSIANKDVNKPSTIYSGKSATLIAGGVYTYTTKTSEKNVKNEPPKIILIEELPPLKTSYSNAGRLKMHEEGYSIGKKTELTELLKQLKNKNNDIIEIIWVWDCSPQYSDMPMKIIYNKTIGNLKEVYTERNVIEDYKNITPECLEQFLKNGEKSLYSLESYCKDASHDFNNREMKQTTIGAKPDQNELDGSVQIVIAFVKSNAKDPSSIDFLEWSKVSSLANNWIVRCKYKGTNSFGTIVTENLWFYIQNNKVIDTKSIS